MAERLIEAERTRTPIRPFTQAYPFLDADTAYKAQWHVVEHRLVGGEDVAGAKLGLTSRVKREALGIHEGTIRVSVGVEPFPLLEQEFAAALSAVSVAGAASSAR